MRCTTALRGPRSLFSTLLLAASVLSVRAAGAAGCASAAGLSPCFDANSLWLPAGPASFLSLPDTQGTAFKQASFGIASEVLHRPVLLHAESPDAGGREIQVVDYAVDSSFFLGFGVQKNLELSLAAPMRVYQSGAGAGGVSAQSAEPVERTAVRNPRLGVGYSLDGALATRGLGLRLALEASLPLGDAGAFASEHSVVAMPSATVAGRVSRLTLGASLGARLRSAVDFGGVRLGNQGFLGLGVGVDLLDPGLLWLSIEAFGLPPLSNTRPSHTSPQISAATLFPAEWLAGVHSSFGTHGTWTLSLAGGTGIPLSSETRQGPTGPTTNYFLGVGTPDFRSLFVLRFVPAAASDAPR